MNLNICAGQLGSPAKRQEASQPQHSRSVRPTAGRMRQPFFNFAPTRKNARFSVLCQKSQQRLDVSFTVIMLWWNNEKSPFIRDLSYCEISQQYFYRSGLNLAFWIKDFKSYVNSQFLAIRRYTKARFLENQTLLLIIRIYKMFVLYRVSPNFAW